MPIYLFLTIFSPKNAIVFFILFIFFDIVPRAEYYGVGSIHTIVIGDVVWPIHYSLIFILIIGYCFRRVYLNENLFKTDKLGILILFFMATFAVKYAISMSNPLGLVQIKVVEIGLLSAMYFVYTGELKNPQNIYYVLKWMWFGMIAMLIYGYYQLIFGNYTDYNIPFQMSYILHENTITGGYFALFTFIVYHLEKRKKVDVIKVFIVLFFLRGFLRKSRSDTVSQQIEKGARGKAEYGRHLSVFQADRCEQVHQDKHGSNREKSDQKMKKSDNFQTVRYRFTDEFGRFFFR